ncbi:cupin domain-containing protein [Ceratobasidium sp. AG-Ba]|nr:cupin domain-containing protein [Ceratobasidium sp. AG-Ba]QRW07596.1 cupin domain-containing protein [Ceratobasidium sp. AG-Ba]
MQRQPKYLANAPSLLEPCTDVPGEMHTSIFEIGRKLGLHTDRWGINLESLPHGTRSSIPHAHNSRDEFVYVISGTGLVWLDGHTYEVGPGDCVGFPAGTGEAHTFIKDGVPDAGWQDEYEERTRGGPLVLLVIGENGRGDHVYYPRGEFEHPSKMRHRAQWWKDPPPRPRGSHSGWPFKPRTESGSLLGDANEFGPPSTRDPPPAAFWPTTGRVLHAKVMPAPCPFVPGAASAMLSSFTGLSGRFDVTQLRLPPTLSSHYAPAALPSKEQPSKQAAPDAVARAQGDTLVYVLEGQGELHVWNAYERGPIKTETSPIGEGDCAVFPGGSGLAWSVRNNAAEGSKEDLDVLIVEEASFLSLRFVVGAGVVYPCARDVADARARVIREGGKWWDVGVNGKPGV